MTVLHPDGSMTVTSTKVAFYPSAPAFRVAKIVDEDSHETHNDVILQPDGSMTVTSTTVFFFSSVPAPLLAGNSEGDGLEAMFTALRQTAVDDAREKALDDALENMVDTAFAHLSSAPKSPTTSVSSSTPTITVNTTTAHVRSSGVGDKSQDDVLEAMFAALRQTAEDDALENELDAAIAREPSDNPEIQHIQVAYDAFCRAFANENVEVPAIARWFLEYLEYHYPNIDHPQALHAWVAGALEDPRVTVRNCIDAEDFAAFQAQAAALRYAMQHEDYDSMVVNASSDMRDSADFFRSMSNDPDEAKEVEDIYAHWRNVWDPEDPNDMSVYDMSVYDMADHSEKSDHSDEASEDEDEPQGAHDAVPTQTRTLETIICVLMLIFIMVLRVFFSGATQTDEYAW